MRSNEEIRENAFVVARQYLADEGARDRPIEPVYQLHLDMIDTLRRLAEKDAEIERLKAELSQSHASTEKLSRGLWKDC